MDLNTPQQPFENRRTRLFRGMAAAEWLQAASVAVAAAVFVVALFCTR